jgi:hypothetical protein
MRRTTSEISDLCQRWSDHAHEMQQRTEDTLDRVRRIQAILDTVKLRYWRGTTEPILQGERAPEWHLHAISKTAVLAPFANA